MEKKNIAYQIILHQIPSSIHHDIHSKPSPKSVTRPIQLPRIHLVIRMFDDNSPNEDAREKSECADSSEASSLFDCEMLVVEEESESSCGDDTGYGA